MVCTATMVDMATLTLTDTTMARGPLMPSPRPMPMHSMVIMVMAWDTTVWATTVLATTGWVMLVMLTLTLMDTTMARGLLMPSPLLMPTMATTTDMLHTLSPWILRLPLRPACLRILRRSSLSYCD